MRKAIVMGAGTYGIVYAELILEHSNYKIVGFLDDDPEKLNKKFSNNEVIGTWKDLIEMKKKGIEYVFAPIGNNRLRVELLQKAKALGFLTPSFIHPQNSIHKSVHLGEAVYCMNNVMIMPHTNISDFCMISMGVSIAHHTNLGIGCFCSMRSIIGASINFGKEVFIGIGSNISTGVKNVGNSAFIGAGSVVINNVKERTVVVGNPAKFLRNISGDNESILLYGTSGHCKVLSDCLNASRIELKALFDDNLTIKEFNGMKVLQYSSEISPSSKVVISIGNNLSRYFVSQKIKHEFGIIKHPSAVLSKNSKIGDGSVLIQDCVVQANVKIGKHVIINTSASVDHDCLIEDYVHISPNVALCGAVEVGEGTHIGAGAVVIPGKKIGKWCIVGAGSVVIKDIPDYSVVVGNPGRIIKYFNPFADKNEK